MERVDHPPIVPGGPRRTEQLLGKVPRAGKVALSEQCARPHAA